MANNFNIHEHADIHPSVIMEGNITVGAFTKIDAGTVLMGDIEIGHHTLIRCNVTIRGPHKIGNFTHIYDNACIEGGRPGGKLGGNINEEADKSIIGDECWINHGASMHGSQIGDRSSIGLNACLDYNTRIGKDCIITNGSSTRINTVIPDRTMVEGVPAKVIKENITDEEWIQHHGLSTVEWLHFQGVELIEKEIRQKLGILTEK
jgi:UDP-N-acetylglucosamine acyltransferase